MIRAIVHDGAWLTAGVLEFPEAVEITMATPVERVDAVARQVLCLAGEPWPMRPAPQTVLRMARQYDLILTWDREILGGCAHAVMLPFGTTWIAPEDRGLEGQKKQFKVTTFCGGKKGLAGYGVREEVWSRAHEIRVAYELWASARTPLPVSFPPTGAGAVRILPVEAAGKRVMFDAMFHVAIENSQWPNYFTEKLIDCFVTGTVPIYWGCPNVGDFFDRDGVVVVRDAEEIIRVCNSLTVEDYTRRRAAIARNFELCQPYCEDFAVRLKRVIMQNLFAGKPAEARA